MSAHLRHALALAALWASMASSFVRAQEVSDVSDAGSYEAPAERPLQRLANQLPPVISEDLDFEGWIWLADLQNNAEPSGNYFDAVFSLALTKSWDQRVAITAQGNFIDADGTYRAELEQGFVSMRLIDETQTLLTIGKFNANFGVEARDFWNRTTGTTSLLFAAQPQDLIGFMITQPMGDTGVTLRPFMSADFQGAYNFDQSPSGGLMVEYRPSSDFNIAVTNWVGPGFVMFGGEDLKSPFPRAYDDEDGEYNASRVLNWEGPNFYAERGGTLYFMEAKATWQARRDLALAAAYLFGTTDTSGGRQGWNGWMFLADFAVTYRTHVWGRYSYLDDSEWFVTGVTQIAQEVSCGIGHHLWDGAEVRAEYRHDFSNVVDDLDSVSIHLTMAF